MALTLTLTPTLDLTLTITCIWLRLGLVLGSWLGFKDFQLLSMYFWVMLYIANPHFSEDSQ